MLSATKKSPPTRIHPGEGPELALLAAQAAIELDSLLIGSAIPLKAVKRLAEVLESSYGGSSNEDRPASPVHPSTAALVRRALDHAHPGRSGTTIEQLMEEASNLVERLNDPDPSGDRSEHERLRAFCAALSLCATSHLHASAELEPRHPYRI